MSQRKNLVVVVLTVALAAGTSFAQQPQAPSQRFSPERTVPPSVHVPHADARPLNTKSGTQAGATSYNFSDSPATAFRQPRTGRAVSNPAAVRQVGYQQDSNQLRGQNTMIPAVLRESAVQPQRRPADQFQPPKKKIHQLKSPGTTKPNPAAGSGIVVDKSQFENHDYPTASSDGAPYRATTPAQHRPVQNRGTQHASANPSQPRQTISRIPAANQSQTMVQPVGYAPQENEKFSSQVRSADMSAAPATPMPDTGVRQVAAASETMDAGAAIQLATPAIEVQVFGPESIGINKVATYKITVTNDGRIDATDLRISASIPETVELQNINVSTGHHEIAAEAEQTELIWNIDRISAGVTHTIAVNAIARSADPFDLDVQWIFAPQVATTQIAVTQPKLEMKIAGPTEVMFGEKATYDVTISNPGTGTAEQVSVMLPQELGGERANIGDIEADGEKRFKVELLARTAGRLNLAATAVGEGNIAAEAGHEILVRRANLAVTIEGPPMKYAGGLGQYIVTVANDGDAPASDVTAVLALPSGVKYLGGIKNAEDNNGGLKWLIGSVRTGDSKIFKVNCQLDASGDLTFQAGARGAGDLAATHQCQTKVDTIADLTLDVADPKGPLPTGEDVDYRLVIRNRGSRSANGVDVVMQFSEGIEPIRAEGRKSKIVTGQVIFAPISRIEPGQEIVLKVTAQASKSGTHIFRGQLTCNESDSREIDEGTTRFFGESVDGASQPLTLPSKFNTADASEDFEENKKDFK